MLCWSLWLFNDLVLTAVIEEAFIGGLVALVRRNRNSLLLTCFSSSKNVVNSVLSVGASSGQSPHQVGLNLRLLRVVSSTRH